MGNDHVFPDLGNCIGRLDGGYGRIGLYRRCHCVRWFVGPGCCGVLLDKCLENRAFLGCVHLDPPSWCRGGRLSRQAAQCRRAGFEPLFSIGSTLCVHIDRHLAFQTARSQISTLNIRTHLAGRNFQSSDNMQQKSLTQYDNLSKAFHWITAIAVAIAFVLGPSDFGRLLHDGIDPGTRIDIVWHESLGITVFTLTLLRLVWVGVRRVTPRPQMTAWMRLLSQLVHLILWVLLFALPITALLALGTEGHPLTLLGGFRINELPLVANSHLSGLADWGEVHKFLGDVIMWLAGIHALAAVYHHFKLKDGVLKSMLP